MFAAVSGLTPLEVQPSLILTGSAGGVRPVVDPGRLGVAVPRFHLLTTRGDLRLIAGAVSAHEVDGWPGSVASDQIAAVSRVLRDGHHGAAGAGPLPAEALEYGLPDRHDLMADEDVDELVEVLEVSGVELGDVTGGQILEADVESLIRCPVSRPDGAHVGLY